MVKITDLGEEEQDVVIVGKVIDSEEKVLKSGKVLFGFDVYDGTSTITCKAFLEGRHAQRIMKRIIKSKSVKVMGKSGLDQYTNEISVMSNSIVEVEGEKKEKRMDMEEVKRVELHLHTKMSQMDGMSSAHDLIERAMDWGMTSIAITDHGVVQSFPEAHHLLRIL